MVPLLAVEFILCLGCAETASFWHPNGTPAHSPFSKMAPAMQEVLKGYKITVPEVYSFSDIRNGCREIHRINHLMAAINEIVIWGADDPPSQKQS